MPHIAILVLMAIVAFIAQTSAPQRRPRPELPPCDPEARQTESDLVLIGRLNAQIQQRFASFDQFGMRRIMSPFQHDPQRLEFGAENEAEHQLVCQLTSNGTDVALFIAGRGLLGYRGVAPEQPLFPGANDAALSDPVHICGDIADLPSRPLLEGAAKDAFATGGAITSSGNWNVTALAIPATSEACINCHNGKNEASTPHPMRFPEAPRLEVGDTIGVAVFAYRTSRSAASHPR